MNKKEVKEMKPMNIKFKKANGNAPYFIYKENKYTIENRSKTYDNKYLFQLMLRKVNPTIEKQKFKTHSEVLDYVRENIKENYEIWRFNPEIVFATETLFYIINKNELRIDRRAIPLSIEFESYSDCLDYSKEYVSRILREKEPVQLRLNID